MAQLYHCEIICIIKKKCSPSRFTGDNSEPVRSGGKISDPMCLGSEISLQKLILDCNQTTEMVPSTRNVSVTQELNVDFQTDTTSV